MYYRKHEDGSIMDWGDGLSPYSEDCIFTEKQVIQAWNGRMYIEGEEPEMPVEMIAEKALLFAKAKRAEEVERLTVEVEGMVFDADETSQARMSVAASSMTDDETNVWVLHDNTVVQVTKAQLLLACRLARIAQSAVWTKPYENVFA